MPPNVKSSDGTAIPDEMQTTREIKRDPIFTRHYYPFGQPQHLSNSWGLLIQHILAVYITYLTFTSQVPASILLFELFWAYLGGLGITVGCHRYWCHKTFKAKLPLQYLLMGMQTIAHQYPIHKWCLDHRIHHKYTDTNADPHNSKRGFWYSHIGWLLVPRSKEFLQAAKNFDMPDLESDPVVRFQSKYYWTLTWILHYIVPISITCYFWDVSLFLGLCSNSRRYIMSLHATWTVNSFAHMVGDKPYDTSISSCDNALVSLVAVGEGWHNYHHTFPWDYKASEFGAWKINPSSLFINFFASIGWAYDLKTVSQKMLRQRLERTGKERTRLIENEILGDTKDVNDFDYNTPGSITEWMKRMEKPAWGWDDVSIPEEFRSVTTILRPEQKLYQLWPLKQLVIHTGKCPISK